MVVHPLAPLVEIVIERIGIGDGLSQVGQGFVVGFRRPVRMHVNRLRLTHSSLPWSRRPPRHSLHRRSLRRRRDDIQHADRGSRAGTNPDEITSSNDGSRTGNSGIFHGHPPQRLGILISFFCAERRRSYSTVLLTPPAASGSPAAGPRNEVVGSERSGSARIVSPSETTVRYY